MNNELAPGNVVLALGVYAGPVMKLISGPVFQTTVEAEELYICADVGIILVCTGLPLQHEAAHQDKLANVLVLYIDLKKD